VPEVVEMIEIELIHRKKEAFASSPLTQFNSQQRIADDS
jgi:hypothetical protein